MPDDATINRSDIVVASRDGPAPLVAATAASGDAFLAMIDRAVSNPSFDETKMGLLEKLVDLRNAEQGRLARIAFDADFAAMQPKLPIIDRNGRIEIREKDSGGKRNGEIQQKSKYALWADILDACKPHMAEHGFGISFRQKTSDEGKIIVTAILNHRCGHREEVESIALMHDSTGSKNSVQAIGSSLSYGMRYTGVMALGIASKEGDDDGAGAGKDGPGYIDDDQLAQLRTLLGYTQSDEAQFCRLCRVAQLEDLTADKFEGARARLQAKLDQQQSEAERGGRS